MSSAQLGVISKYEKDQESSAVEKRRQKTETKSWKLFELNSSKFKQ